MLQNSYQQNMPCCYDTSITNKQYYYFFNYSIFFRTCIFNDYSYYNNKFVYISLNNMSNFFLWKTYSFNWLTSNISYSHFIQTNFYSLTTYQYPVIPLRTLTAHGIMSRDCAISPILLTSYPCLADMRIKSYNTPLCGIKLDRSKYSRNLFSLRGLRARHGILTTLYTYTFKVPKYRWRRFSRTGLLTWWYLAKGDAIQYYFHGY